MNTFVVGIETRWTKEQLEDWLRVFKDSANDPRYHGPGFVPPLGFITVAASVPRVDDDDKD